MTKPKISYDAFYEAIISGDAQAVNYLIINGADVHRQYREHGGTDPEFPLHWAAAKGFSHICRLLIEYGADVNAKNDYRTTTLHLAAESGCEVTVGLLIDSGAKVDVFDRYGRSPLHVAIVKGKEAAYRLLMEKGAAVQSKSINSYTLLHDAARNGDVVACRLLVERGADLFARKNNGGTPLHSAAEMGKLDAVRFLVEAGIASSDMALNPKKTYLTPFQQAVASGQADVVQFFIDHCNEDWLQQTITGRSMMSLSGKSESVKAIFRSLKTQQIVGQIVDDAPDAGASLSVRRDNTMGML